LLPDVISKCEKKKFKGAYQGGLRKALISYGKHNKTTIPDSVRVKGAKESSIEESILEPEQVDAIYSAAETRERVCVALVAYSGLRPKSLRIVDGTDGLRLGDFPELSLERESHTLSSYPQG